MRIEILEALQADQLQQLHGAAEQRLAADAAHLGLDQHVIERGAPRQQQVLLKHDAEVGVGIGHHRVADPHLAARRPLQSGDQRQQRGFSAARRADDGQELAVRDGQVGRAQRLDALGAGTARRKDFAGVPQRDEGLCSCW